MTNMSCELKKLCFKQYICSALPVHVISALNIHNYETGICFIINLGLSKLLQSETSLRITCEFLYELY